MVRFMVIASMRMEMNQGDDGTGSGGRWMVSGGCPGHSIPKSTHGTRYIQYSLLLLFLLLLVRLHHLLYSD